MSETFFLLYYTLMHRMRSRDGFIIKIEKQNDVLLPNGFFRWWWFRIGGLFFFLFPRSIEDCSSSFQLDKHEIGQKTTTAIFIITCVLVSTHFLIHRTINRCVGR